MALQGSGAIALSDIADEFGGSTPHSMSEYYSGGLGPSAVPASGAISFSDFYGTSNMPPWAGTRLISGGGYTTAYTNAIDTKTISSTSNCTSYGTLGQQKGKHASTSDGSYYWAFCGINVWYRYDVIEKKVFASNANASDVGDMPDTAYNCTSAVSNGTRGLVGHRYEPDNGDDAPYYGYRRDIRYLTFASSTSTSSFGNLTNAVADSGSHDGDTRGIFTGGYAHQGGSSGSHKNIDYVTIASTGNASDFGDLNGNGRQSFAGCGSTTRAWFCGGWTGARMNDMQYITVASTGNGTDAGDLTDWRNATMGASDNEKAEIVGGYAASTSGGSASRVSSIQYFTISSTNSAASSYNLTATNDQMECAAGT